MDCLGKLTIELMTRGVIPDSAVRILLQGQAEPCDFKELSFSLAEDFFVQAPVAAEPAAALALRCAEGGVFLDTGNERWEVGLIPQPRFLQAHLRQSGPPAANTGLDGYCLNLYLRTLGHQKNLNMKESEVLSLVRSAFEEGAAEFVQLNMDFCKDPDRGFRFLEPLVRAIKRNFRTFVALRGFAPEDLTTLDHIYAAGVDLLVLPLEGFSSAARLEEILPQEHSYRALEYAKDVFAEGTVLTELMLIAENQGLLFHKIDLLTKKGILPLLKLPNLGMEPGVFEQVQEVVEHLANSVRASRLPLKWLYPGAQFVSPLDAGFYTQPAAKAKPAARPIYKSTLGKTASEGFAALRRALRVKNISDSYESAGL
ncbi:MAG: hypothetical protein ACE5ER_08900 [Nitrospinaceae bacterium]